jgi:hypothetical protein
VLRREDLHLVAGRECHAGCVGAGVLLCPPRALHEADALDISSDDVVALDPQQVAGAVGEGDDHPVGGGAVDQQASHDRHERREHVLSPVGPQVVRAEVGGWNAPLRVDATEPAAHPGVHHLAANRTVTLLHDLTEGVGSEISHHEVVVRRAQA